ncbi:MAG TPA: DUF559 domain-containing protein [Myxococcota bacterium]
MTRTMTAAARTLRRETTPPAQRLWERVRSRRLGGFRFRRQHAVDRFVLDFYCAEARLGIELDGQHHHGHAVSERDGERTSALLMHGIHVIRFDNDAIFDDEEGVLAAILAHLRRDLSQPAEVLRAGSGAFSRREKGG